MSKTVLITGATSGIGYELGKLFAKDGYDLVLVSRHKAELETVAHELNDFGGFVKVIAADLSKQDSAESIYKELLEDRITVDVLVNNAGAGIYGEFTRGNLVEDKKIMNLNMVSLTVLTRLFLSAMVEKGEGRILNVASTAAYLPGPMMAIYYATKAYVLSFSMAIAEELAGSGVSVTAFCPGPTATNFQQRARAGRSQMFGRIFVMDAATVAAAGYRGLMNGKMVVIPGWRNKLMVLGAKFAPERIKLMMVSQVQRKTRSL